MDNAQRLSELDAQIRDRRRLGAPTSGLFLARRKLLASMQEAAREAARAAQRDMLAQERWHAEHYRREK